MREEEPTVDEAEEAAVRGICGVDRLLAEFSVIGSGDVDSDIELMPDVLAESVPAELLSRPIPSAGIGTGLTTPAPGELAALLIVVSATVLATVASPPCVVVVAVSKLVGAIN